MGLEHMEWRKTHTHTRAHTHASVMTTRSAIMHHTPLQIIQFMIQILELLILMKQLLLKVLILGLRNHRLHQLL